MPKGGLRVTVDVTKMEPVKDMASVMVEMLQYIPEYKFDYFNNRIERILEDMKK